MKKLISFLVILLLPFLVKAQDPQPVYGDYIYPGSVLFDNGLYIPVRDTTGFAPYRVGALVILPQDTVGHPATPPIRFWNGDYWGSIVGGAGNIYFGNNGIHLASNTFQLGDSLNHNTDIKTKGYAFSLNGTVKGAPLFRLSNDKQEIGFTELDSTASGYIYVPNGKQGEFRFYAKGVPVGMLKQGSFQLNDSSLNNYFSSGKDFLTLTGSTGSAYAEVSPGSTILSTTSGSPYAVFNNSFAQLPPLANTNASKYLSVDATGKLFLNTPSGIKALDSLRYDPSTGIFYGRYTTGEEFPVATGLVDSLQLRLPTSVNDIRYINNQDTVQQNAKFWIRGIARVDSIVRLQRSFSSGTGAVALDIQDTGKGGYITLQNATSTPGIFQPGLLGYTAYDTTGFADKAMRSFYIVGRYRSNDTTGRSLAEKNAIMTTGGIMVTGQDIRDANYRPAPFSSVFSIITSRTLSSANIGLRYGGDHNMQMRGGIAVGYPFSVNDTTADDLNVYLKKLPTGVKGMFNGNVRGSDAVDSSDFVTYRQLFQSHVYGTDNTLNSFLVQDGQGKLWVRSVDSMPFIKNQLALPQTADIWTSGTTRHVGAFQKVDAVGATSSLIDFYKSDNSTVRTRMGLWNAGVFAGTDNFGVINFLGSNALITKRDSVLLIGDINGATVTSYMMKKSSQFLFYKAGLRYDLATNKYIDSATTAVVNLSGYFMEVNAGAGGSALKVTGNAQVTGVVLSADAANANELATKGQNDIAYKSKISATKTVTASATNLITDEITFINNPAAATTITLPAAAGNTGRTLEFAVNNSAVQTITIGPYSTTAATGGCRLVSDGTNWRIISKF